MCAVYLRSTDRAPRRYVRRRRRRARAIRGSRCFTIDLQTFDCERLYLRLINIDNMKLVENDQLSEKAKYATGVPWEETEDAGDLCVPHNYPTVKISCAFEPKAEGTGQLPLSQISSNSGDSEFVITSPSVEPHLINSEEFDDLYPRKQAWLSLKAVIHGFLGNRKAENYTELITDMLHNFKVMGCRMSLKVHMLHAHLDKFKDNLGAYSEEQGNVSTKM
ncbi:hypothetical protein EVAR_77853_1 [Eumeta japonica]|uniref:Uncharacterized protein n=1 Tax=Eumeta variegata TaxID=151549 RepID=A0A4C1TE82_EUMVA|nr:hypothetical protein EVAR_77853_1 [Eumeta japonica]